MKWLELSEIVTGLAIANKLPVNAVNPDYLMEPHNKLVTAIQQGKGGDLVEKFGVAVIQSSLDAATRAAKLPQSTNWLSMLERAASKYAMSLEFDRLSKRLADGEDLDPGRVADLLEGVYKPETGNLLVPMSKVDTTGDDYKLCGYAPFDIHIGGLPNPGMTILSGLPGTGKTSLMVKMAAQWVSKYPKSHVAIFSLEMTSKQLTRRAIKTSVELSNKPKLMDRIWLADGIVSPAELSSIAARATKGTDLIMIDFAEMMMQNEDASESVMASIYLTIAGMAKRLGIPVVLLAQLNRKYAGGMPNITNLRYSAMAEILAALIVFTYNPRLVWAGGNNSSTAADDLTVRPGKGLLIVSKTRFGTKYEDASRGAIEVPWNGGGLWGDKPSTWHLLKSGG